MDELTLEITTPSRTIFNNKIKSVTIPGTEGSFQVLKNHAPLLSTFEIGLIKVVDTSDKTLYFATGGGTAEVLNNKVLVLADSIEAPDDIDIERAKLAKAKAEERLSKREKETDLERAKLALARAVNRLSIVEKYVRGLA
jgi:F-type H+-transporting ATPase subunit epsilon